MELDIDEKRRTLKRRFVPFAQRTLYALKVDVAGCMTTAQMNDLVESALRETGCSRRDMADVTLVGDLDVNCEKDIAYILDSEAGILTSRLRRIRDKLRKTLTHHKK